MEGDETESLGTALTFPNDIDGKRDSDSFEPISLLEEDDLGSEQYDPGGAVRAPKRRRRKKSKAAPAVIIPDSAPALLPFFPSRKFSLTQSLCALALSATSPE